MAVEKWDLDPMHSSINFWVRHLAITKIRGRFTKWSGTMQFDEENPRNSRLEVRVDAASLDTGQQQRDDHVRGPEFLDVAKYPEITFVSTSVEPEGPGRFKVRGDLTVRGVTRPLTLEAEHGGRATHPYLGERTGFSVRGVINRKDYGVAFHQVLDTGGLVLSDEIAVDIEVQAARAKEVTASGTA